MDGSTKNKSLNMAEKTRAVTKTDSARKLPKKPDAKASAKASASFPSAPADFTRLFYDLLMPSDLAPFSAHDRERMAASMWALAQKRKPGILKMRLFNPSPVKDGWTVDHTVLETVNDDMPFLVDSITGALQRRGLSVHLVIHPVMRVKRNAQGELLE